jgi:hypothetical protein
MIKRMLIAIVMVAMLVASSHVVAQNTVGIDYSGQTYWRGFELFDADDSIQPTTNVALAKNILFGVTGYVPESPDHQTEDERWDAFLKYIGEFKDFTYEVGYGYYMFPEFSNADGPNIQEAFVTLRYPLSNGLVPRYTWVHAWESSDDSDPIEDAADLHVIGVDYVLDVNEVFEDIITPGVVFRATADITYNDGFNTLGVGSVDSDWSHGIIGVMLEVPVGEIKVMPAVYHQCIFDKSIGRDGSETFVRVGIKQPF